MQLAVPLSGDQMNAANRLHGRLKQWALADRALALLVERFPAFDAEACLLKTVAINALYGTQVFALTRMARHVEQVMTSTNPTTATEDLVKAIAHLPPTDAQKSDRHHRSFASKFCHFFIDADRFPIKDSYAEEMLKRHLGRAAYERDPNTSYKAYVRNFRRLQQAVGGTVKGRDLDHYLWIAGQYLEWKKQKAQGNKPKTNAELNALFENPSPGDVDDLRVLVPPVLDKAFKGAR